MSWFHAIEPAYSMAAFAVGVLVGMTGVGGGSLMTPLLIFLFGIHPATAVGTDLLSAAVSKTAGSIVHGLARSIEWRVVRRLAMGSVPATVTTLGFLSVLNQSEAARSLITVILSGVLLVTAAVLVFRGSIVRFYRSRLPVLDERGTATATIVVGAILGVLVTISSVGAGAIGVCVLLLSETADGQDCRVGHRACGPAHARRRLRPLVPGIDRFFRLHLADPGVGAWNPARELCRRSRSGSRASPCARGHAAYGRDQAVIRPDGAAFGRRCGEDHHAALSP